MRREMTGARKRVRSIPLRNRNDREEAL